jgi:lambda repressor-like predicted transcriptional regulator
MHVQEITDVPHAQCTVCRHEQREAIDAALQRGEPSLRELAKQVGLTYQALWRHRQHGVPVKGKVISNIKAEIARLRHAQTAAKKRRDTNAVVVISREIRNWMVLEAKTANVIPTDAGKAEELSRSEALSMARAIIESQLHDTGVQLWLEELTERLRASCSVPEAQD